mmetsp:Transcript_3979/g.11342  ORF Transcript_3979/g.11342 Transcript_3979/m.11342 type:complete len:91 (-) Transcript_3979:459-731(-)
MCHVCVGGGLFSLHNMQSHHFDSFLRVSTPRTKSLIEEARFAARDFAIIIITSCCHIRSCNKADESSAADIMSSSGTTNTSAMLCMCSKL